MTEELVKPMNDDEFAALKVGGVKVHYLAVCRRKLWLYAHDIRMEQESDRVLLGRTLHEEAYPEQSRRELLFDNLVKMDIVENSGKVLEVKYSQAMKDAARLQILYYLYYLKRLGKTELVGELRFPKERRREEVHLTPEAETEVENALREIRQIEVLPSPPVVEQMPICRSCAYAELCWG